MKYLLLVVFIFTAQLTFAQFDEIRLIEKVKLEGTPVFYKSTNTFSNIRILIRRISIDSGEISFFCICRTRFPLQLDSFIFKSSDNKTLVIKKRFFDSLYTDTSTYKLTLFSLSSLNKAQIEFFRQNDIREIIFGLPNPVAVEIKRKSRKALQDF